MTALQKHLSSITQKGFDEFKETAFSSYASSYGIAFGFDATGKYAVKHKYGLDRFDDFEEAKNHYENGLIFGSEVYKKD